MQEIYRPILRGYFAAFALYYWVMFSTHFLFFTGVQLFSIAAAAGLAAGVGTFGAWFMRKPEPTEQVELLLVVMNLLVVWNVIIALNIGFNPAKLVYFIIIAMAFALASVSLRQSLASLALAAVAFTLFLPGAGEDTIIVYAFLALGAGFASIAISQIIRKAIARIAESKIEAEEELAEVRLMSSELERKSQSDSLTGLPNRRAFFNGLRIALRQLAEGKSGWLILVDLDGFKAVNDVHGHLTGDMLLKEVAYRLRSYSGPGVLVSRMGGDEFNIVWQTELVEGEVLRHCNRMLDTLSAPYLIDDRHVRISASIGCRRIDNETSVREQISQADFALMAAKKQGRNRAVFFNGELERQAEARSEVDQALRNADLAKEIDIVFQPQFHLGSDRIIRAEVLARWSSSAIGPIEPRRFIKIAEESGLITGITLIVIEKAFRELRSWSDPIPVSINLSSNDIISETTIQAIIELANRFGILPKLIEFEVTETAMMADVDKAIANLERLGRLGFSIALDDFGTGYSNFSYLRSLPISKLKVDRSFLENPGDPMTEKILSSLAGMARILGVHCLLEGVEDEIGLLMARRAGAESVQGYLFGRPMSSKELLELVKGPVANDLGDVETAI